MTYTISGKTAHILVGQIVDTVAWFVILFGHKWALSNTTPAIFWHGDSLGLSPAIRTAQDDHRHVQAAEPRPKTRREIGPEMPDFHLFLHENNVEHSLQKGMEHW